MYSVKYFGNVPTGTVCSWYTVPRPLHPPEIVQNVRLDIGLVNTEEAARYYRNQVTPKRMEYWSHSRT